MNEYVFTWTLQPAGVVTDTYTAESGPFVITVATDRITIRVWAPETDRDQLVGEARQLVENLANLFRAQYHHALALGSVAIETLHSDSRRRDIEVRLIGGTLRISGGVADFIVRDTNGKIIDSSEIRRQREGQEQRRRIIHLAARAAQDPVLSEMLRYRTEYECNGRRRLHHLYDLLQVAERVYGRREDVADALHLNERDLSELGRISNEPTLTNGRHPGESSGPHRPATPEEIRTCERVADAIIDARSGFQRIP